MTDMYHLLTILHTSFLPIGAVSYKQLPPIDTIPLLLSSFSPTSTLFYTSTLTIYIISFRLFNGYEDVVYFTFSLGFVILRSFLVSIIAARVHSASLMAAPSLYNVPSPSYCTEVSPHFLMSKVCCD